jgi:RNA recognition motif-containing protein
MRDKHLKSYFGKFGEIVDVNVPMKNDTLNRGFCFIEYKSKEMAQRAIDEMNNKQWKGRTVAMEFSVPKGSYEARITGIVEHTKLERDQAVLPKVLRDEKQKAQEVKEQKEKEKKEYEEKNAAKIKKQEKKKAKK